MKTRIATASDLDGLTATITAAFAGDPLWNWAIPDLRAVEVWWRFLIASALRYDSTWISGDYAAAAVWIPPGGTELTHAEEERVEPLMAELVGPRAPAVLELLDRFETSHPQEEEHSYLSLLAVHPDHRGRGLGMGLLAENVETLDSEGVPAYLESTNPANDRRYERLGFRQVGSFTTPDEEHSVATMWREVAFKAAGGGGQPLAGA